jgi:hypothetical protein
MPEIDESQIKIALSAVEDARPKYSIRQADLSERSQILTNQRAVENLLTSFKQILFCRL